MGPAGLLSEEGGSWHLYRKGYKFVSLSQGAATAVSSGRSWHCSRFQRHPYTFCFVSLCGYLVLIELLLQGHCNKMEFLLCGAAWRLLTSLYWLLHCFIIFIHNYMICLQIDIRTCFLIYVSLCVEPIFRLTINLQPNVFIVILLPCMWCKCWSFRFLLPLWQAFLELSMSLCCLFQSQASGFLSLTRFNASCREWFCG